MRRRRRCARLCPGGTRAPCRFARSVERQSWGCVWWAIWVELRTRGLTRRPSVCAAVCGGARESVQPNPASLFRAWERSVPAAGADAARPRHTHRLPGLGHGEERPARTPGPRDAPAPGRARAVVAVWPRRPRRRPPWATSSLASYRKPRVGLADATSTPAGTSLPPLSLSSSFFSLSASSTSAASTRLKPLSSGASTGWPSW